MLEPTYFSSLSQALSTTERLKWCQMRVDIKCQVDEPKVTEIENAVM